MHLQHIETHFYFHCRSMPAAARQSCKGCALALGLTGNVRKDALASRNDKDTSKPCVTDLHDAYPVANRNLLHIPAPPDLLAQLLCKRRAERMPLGMGSGEPCSTASAKTLPPRSDRCPTPVSVFSLFVLTRCRMTSTLLGCDYSIHPQFAPLAAPLIGRMTAAFSATTPVSTAVLPAASCWPWARMPHTLGAARLFPGSCCG